MQDAILGKPRAENGADSGAKAGSGLWKRILEPLQGLLWALKPLMQGSIRRTTLLLMFIWFTNALCYYGLVLLTTSVRSLPKLHPLVLLSAQNKISNLFFNSKQRTGLPSWPGEIKLQALPKVPLLHGVLAVAMPPAAELHLLLCETLVMQAGMLFDHPCTQLQS